MRGGNYAAFWPAALGAGVLYAVALAAGAVAALGYGLSSLLLGSPEPNDGNAQSIGLGMIVGAIQTVPAGGSPGETADSRLASAASAPAPPQR